MASATFSSKGILRVTSTTIITITVLESFSLLLGIPSSDIIGELRGVAERTKPEEFANRDPQNLYDICQVLISNQFPSKYSQELANSPTTRQGEVLLRRLLKKVSRGCDTNELFSTADEAYLIGVKTYCSSRSLFLSMDGHVGLAPKEARLGDIVIALLGCDSAMALHPDQHGKYLLVGEALCSKVMDGAAFLGSLPDSLEAVKMYSEQEEEHYWEFFDRDSGTFQSEDPRLINLPLPAGWKRERHPEEKIRTRYVNDEIEEDNVYFDLRLTPHELERRGVELEEFDII